MNEQLIFNFQKPKETFSSADFICHKGNHIAHDYIMNNQWKSPVTCITGFKHTGKTTLLNLWSKKEKAVAITPSSLTKENMTTPTSFLFKNNLSAFSLDNIEQFLLNKNLEENLFHLYNHCVQENKKLLLTSSKKPSSLSFILPDLASRLKSIPSFFLEEPSASEKEIFIIKYFSDFQLSLDMGIVSYIRDNGPQNLKYLKKLIEDLYILSMKQKKKITITLLRKLLSTTKN